MLVALVVVVRSVIQTGGRSSTADRFSVPKPVRSGQARRAQELLDHSRASSHIFLSSSFTLQSDIMATKVDQKLLRATKFPPEFDKKVDMQKVNIEVMKT